ncbi:phosphonate ABC transporter ATP-binding protein [Undibacterium sp. SXout7W]|uniref:phosphonate ABC transporter ATP-binding protein n=1 Tax=Undibacterium sp. SXout7W TaxID=3413049 RepID=UPI003BF1467F
MTFQLQAICVQHPEAQQVLALQDITLSIQAGEQLALIGPSGAGKTSLLHTLACAIQPTLGNMHAFETEPWKVKNKERHQLRSRLFLAPQTPPLPPRQRVINAVLAGKLPQWSTWKALCSLIKPAEPLLAYEALSHFHLQEKLYARVDRLSGGERQRCSMARALVSNAEAFLMDEPLSALDPVLAIQTLNVLQTEARQRQAVLVCSLHQVELARQYFPRIIGLCHGRIVFDESSNNVTDEMIASLYKMGNQQQIMPSPPSEPSHTLKANSVISRC